MLMFQLYIFLPAVWTLFLPLLPTIICVLVIADRSGFFYLFT